MFSYKLFSPNPHIGTKFAPALMATLTNPYRLFNTTLDEYGCANMDSLAPPVTNAAQEPGAVLCFSACITMVFMNLDKHQVLPIPADIRELFESIA